MVWIFFRIIQLPLARTLTNNPTPMPQKEKKKKKQQQKKQNK